MANQIKKDPKTKTSVKIASDKEVTGLHKNLLLELEAITETRHLLASDELPFLIFLDFTGFSHPNLKNRYQKFIKQKMETAFGCSFPEEIFKYSLTEACSYISKNRTLSKIKLDPANFLGIKFLKELKTNDLWTLSYPFSIKDHVDYMTGYLTGKLNAFHNNDKLKEYLEKDLYPLRTKTYGSFTEHQYEVQTEEGDIVRFYNLYEVCCWMIARASNYNPDLMIKENW